MDAKIDSERQLVILYLPNRTTSCYAERRSGRTHLKAQQASDSLLSPRTYFHLKKSCIENDTSERIGPESIRITADIKAQLKPIHLNKLKEEFGVNI